MPKTPSPFIHAGSACTIFWSGQRVSLRCGAASATLPVVRSSELQLQRGTTGFWHVSDPPLPSTDSRQFRADLYHVARVVGADVLYKPRRDPSANCNFYDALLDLSGVHIRVLLNVVNPLVAFARDWASPGSPPVFVDQSDLAAAFAELAYTVISLQTLESPVTNDNIALLAPAEVEQLDYWKPNRIGDVVFNYWD